MLTSNQLSDRLSLMETEETENHNVYELGVVSGKRDNKICFNYDPTRWTTYNRLEQEQDLIRLALFVEGYTEGYGVQLLGKLD